MCLRCAGVCSVIVSYSEKQTLCYGFFFFSSRRRHTRFDCDWSSDVCSSDLAAKRQPGSAFKPFVYLAALERGLTPDSVREDRPIELKGWKPENYTREYFGPVTLTRALALSLNTVSVRLTLEVGPKTVVRTAHRLGVTSPLNPNASIALGTSEVSVIELVSAFTP